jgi:hypothetical protein
MKGTATFIKDTSESFKGRASLYKFSPPMKYTRYEEEGEIENETEFVVVSSLERAFDTGKPETYIFPSDEEGKVLSWGEIGASQRGTTDHELVLNDSGYTIKEVQSV